MQNFRFVFLVVLFRFDILNGITATVDTKSNLKSSLDPSLEWDTVFFTLKLDNSTGEMVYSLGISDLENVNPPDLTKLPYSSVKESQISGNIYIYI